MASVPAEERACTMSDYTTRWHLPSGVACEGGCVLQRTNRTANSCVDPCSEAECGDCRTTPPAATPLPAGACPAARCCSSTTFMESVLECIMAECGGGVARTPSGYCQHRHHPCNIIPKQFRRGMPYRTHGDKCRSCTWFHK